MDLITSLLRSFLDRRRGQNRADRSAALPVALLSEGREKGRRTQVNLPPTTFTIRTLLV